MNLNKTKVPRALLLVSFWILLLSIVVIYGSVQKSVIAASANQEGAWRFVRTLMEGSDIIGLENGIPVFKTRGYGHRCPGAFSRNAL